MASEAGAKNGIFEVDDITLEYVNARVNRNFTVYKADADAEYDEEFVIDLSTITPTVACPHLPENTKKASELSEIIPDQVVIGSCTNGRLSDMAAAAKIMEGNHIANGIRCIIIPATQSIYKECIKLGYIDTFIDAGCVVSTPTCGPCLGGYMGILAEDEIAVATTNRNFVGRMGHISSKIYLSSPEVAAATAIKGYICDPRDLK
jgi:3-isopropylmalate/(R)-2-methylmalate dehydratase large subunit